MMEQLRGALAELDRVAAGPFSRDDAGAVRAAYGTLVDAYTGGVAATPHDHFCTLIACPTSDPTAMLRLCDRASTARLVELAAAGDVPRLEAAATLAKAAPGVAFDPAAHALVATDLTVLSYLHPSDLGPDARLEASHFKCAVLYW